MSSQKQGKRKFYSDASNRVSIFIDEEGSFIFSMTDGSMITKEIGFCEDSADKITFYSGIPLDEFVGVEFLEGISDSLQISIKGTKLFGDLHSLKIMKDTIIGDIRNKITPNIKVEKIINIIC